jgi:acyl carrier protein
VPVPVPVPVATPPAASALVVSDAGLQLPPASPSAAAKPSTALGLPADGDLKTYLLTIVSEKTGYPIEILNLDQHLETDLGIDSIKRVEILSAFEGQIPDIKDVNLEEVTSLATLRDVLGFMERYADKLGLQKKND